ncbi:hypothetical protein IMG5_111120 [Ichthyophthirius multifiliis]|uniref:RNA helicase n=1 Tax=Ichthyophthirius multifiliis TaxID=5932 RepID=G0QTS7_ICHMU|nr:hypothetical protein IMG5_111120 [Ichthyophthirius multifiliis]EGR31377.1 hypothetical protein IMG5_111120 [Ichthyophthirius multifiliis]|eukprot:XP_004034863.1 hypothetical protein IMG5_111120 [Ichthyophthirius multifiliis]
MQKQYNINPKILENMKKAGYMRPTPIQMQAIPIIMEKRSLMALAPTGSGKTAAYSLPIIKILEKHEKIGVRALIFAPTNELGEQIRREIEFLTYGLKDAVRVKYLQKINTEINGFKKEIEHIDILICTPLKFLKITKRAQEKFEFLQFLVFDEADRYFEFNLAKQMKKILENFQDLHKVNYLLFSATIQHPVEELVKQLIHEPLKLTVGGKNNVLQCVEQKLQYCQSEFGKLLEIKNIINSGQFNPPVLIFVQSKDRGEQLLEMVRTSFLNTQIKIERIDSVFQKYQFFFNKLIQDKSKQDREIIIEQFRLGKIWALICTDLMARGIDFKGVNLVINYDFPTTIINYIHRVGRTGRAGRSGKAITFYTNQDKPILRNLGNMLKISGCEVPEWIFSLQKADKKTLKHIEKFPIKRENISLDPEMQKQDDKEFENQIRIADGQFYSLQKKKKKEENNEDGGKWQIA